MDRLNLRDIESRSWKARQQDGLFDIYFGGLMLAISLSALVEALGAAPVVRLITLIVLQFSSAGGFALAKRRYATPRVGAVKFGASRVRRSRVLQAALGFCVLVTAVLVVWTAFGPSPLNLRLGRYALPTVVTLVVGIPLTAIAIVLEFGRVLLHAALFAGATFALAASGQSFMAPIPGAIAFGASGTISTVIGVVIFGRFVRRVPCHPMEATGDDR